MTPPAVVIPHPMTPRDGDRLLLLGACARSLAQSALRGQQIAARFPDGVIALDFFGDADLAGGAVTVLSVARDFGLPRTVAGLCRAALAIEWESVAVAGGLENRPGLLRLLSRRGRLLGSAPDTIRGVRDPDRLFSCLAHAGLPHAASLRGRRVPSDGRAWLLKRRRGAGGGGVREAGPGEPVPPGWYAQEHLTGRTGSATFLADGRSAVLLGTSEQLTGLTWLGASGFRHAGNLVEGSRVTGGPADLLAAEGVEAARRIACGLASRFGLRGLAGFDFVAVDGIPLLIEVNPRWTASMELIEEATGISLFAAHLMVCDGAGAETAAAAAGCGTAASRPASGVLARGVLYASEPLLTPPPALLEALGARDRPREGERIEVGQPICTLTATGATRVDALAALRSRAEGARRLLAPAPGCGSRRGADRIDPSRQTGDGDTGSGTRARA
jgi:uncharacterized protein